MRIFSINLLLRWEPCPVGQQAERAGILRRRGLLGRIDNHGL